MNKQAFRLIIPFLLSGSILLTIIAARQPQFIRPTQPSLYPEQVPVISKLETISHPSETIHTITRTAIESFPDSQPSQTEWADTCDNCRMEISGIGMGDVTTTLNPQTLSLIDPTSVDSLLIQVAGRYSNDTPTPESVMFTTNAPEAITVSQPSSHTDEGYTFETNLQPTSHITALVNNPGGSYKTPRGLILYALRRTGEVRWTSVGKTMNRFVYRNSYTESLTFQPLITTTDLFITAVVIDNQDDTRPLKLEATAGNIITQSQLIAGPSHGLLLNIISLTLPQVPIGTDRVNITLHSPPYNGDSLVWVGVNVSYQCGNVNSQVADLAVSKTVNDPTPNVGDIITYTVTVINNGPDEASGVQISDKLSTGVTYVPPYNASQGNYDSESGLWLVGNLSNTANTTLTLIAKVNDDMAGQTILNTASIFVIDQIDPISNNNTNFVTINVTLGSSPHLTYLPIIFKDYPPPLCHTETFTSDDPVIGWPPPPTSPLVLVEYFNGEYHMLTRDTTQVHSVTSPLGPYTNYSVQVDVRWAITTSYVDDDYGIVFDLTISNNNRRYYQFNVNNDSNTYRLRKRENNHWINLIPPTPAPSSCILGGTSVNKLKIQRNSSSIDLFINKCQLPSYTSNSQLTLPRPAFMGVNIFPSDFVNGEAYFDNFIICTYEQNQVSIHELLSKPTLTTTPK